MQIQKSCFITRWDKSMLINVQQMLNHCRYLNLLQLMPRRHFFVSAHPSVILQVGELHFACSPSNSSIWTSASMWGKFSKGATATRPHQCRTDCSCGAFASELAESRRPSMQLSTLYTRSQNLHYKQNMWKVDAVDTKHKPNTDCIEYTFKCE